MQLNISLIEYIVPLCPLSLATILCAVAGCEIVRAACRWGPAFHSVFSTFLFTVHIITGSYPHNSCDPELGMFLTEFSSILKYLKTPYEAFANF